MFALTHFLFFLFLIVPILIGVGICYILTLQRALSRCAPQNRATSPESAWLLLIPLFNIVWQFILYPRISESLEREFRSRNLPIEPQPAKNLGLALAVLHVCSYIPAVHFFTAIAGFICFVFYWSKISGYSNQLAHSIAYAPNVPQPASAPQPTGAFCTKCGGPMQIDERFCRTCGAPVL
jgi:hypothetical protein